MCKCKKKINNWKYLFAIKCLFFTEKWIHIVVIRVMPPCGLIRGYSRIKSTKFPASGTGNINKPTLMSQVTSVQSQYISASAAEAVEVPVIICLYNNCNHTTEAGGLYTSRDSLWRLLHKNDRIFVDVILL